MSITHFLAIKNIQLHLHRMKQRKINLIAKVMIR